MDKQKEIEEIEPKLDKRVKIFIAIIVILAVVVGLPCGIVAIGKSCNDVYLPNYALETVLDVLEMGYGYEGGLAVYSNNVQEMAFHTDEDLGEYEFAEYIVEVITEDCVYFRFCVNFFYKQCPFDRFFGAKNIKRENIYDCDCSLIERRDAENEDYDL